MDKVSRRQVDVALEYARRAEVTSHKACYKCGDKLSGIDAALACVCRQFFCSAHSMPTTGHKCSTISRCAVCKKRVGLSAVECLCGRIFCGLHKPQTASAMGAEGRGHKCDVDVRALQEAEDAVPHKRARLEETTGGGGGDGAVC